MDFSFRYPDKPIETSPTVVGSLVEQEWITQAKYDGWRTQIYVDGPGNVRLLSRTGRPMAKTNAKMHPSFAEGFEQMDLPANTVIDAEFVGPRGHQEQAIYIFDMLAWDGEWLVREPYKKRWERCKQLELPMLHIKLFGTPISDDGSLLASEIRLAETVECDFLEFFNRLKATWDGKSIDLCEGIVVKARNGKLKLDRNRSQKSDCMLKLKYREIVAARY